MTKQTVVNDLHREFCNLVAEHWVLPEDIEKSAMEIAFHPLPIVITRKPARRALLCEVISKKFRLYKATAKSILDSLGAQQIFPSRVQKRELESILNSRSHVDYDNWLATFSVARQTNDPYEPLADSSILEFFQNQLTSATVNRSDARIGVQTERRDSLLRSTFGTWFQSCFDQHAVHAIHSKKQIEKLPQRYFEYLQQDFPEVLRRQCGGVLINVPSDWWGMFSSDSITDHLIEHVQNTYTQLSNHSYYMLRIEFPSNNHDRNKIWGVISDVTLYSERHREEIISKGFFKPENIREQTVNYVPNIGSVDFQNFHFGFMYRDCILSTDQNLTEHGSTATCTSALLLFEKHLADETPIPCPKCRSLNVGGNSYPIFGVKSWECRNPICSDRSAFDRGYRFSAMSVLRNEASNSGATEIPEESLKRWKLDVVETVSESEAIEMFVRHYSLPKDTIVLINSSVNQKTKYGRKLILQTSSPKQKENSNIRKSFFSNTFFQKYLHQPELKSRSLTKPISRTPDWLTLYQGSCLTILPQLAPNSIDGAVTSPPYYNAREYSQWSNLYCYLYDMQLAARGVFNALKPGGYYLFNIFDNFDNDNILARSALGKRRITLSSYLSNIFTYVGFELAGNIAWHKGEIEGKRNYNQGNRFPYFQLPLNCWEHILVLRKPAANTTLLDFPDIVKLRPVIKWVKGENRHGHTAPFPETLPQLLCSRLDQDSTILDPFAGSLTTARVTHLYNQKAIAIELHEEYCDLGLKMLSPPRQTSLNID